LHGHDVANNALCHVLEKRTDWRQKRSGGEDIGVRRISWKLAGQNHPSHSLLKELTKVLSFFLVGYCKKSYICHSLTTL